MIVFDLKCTSAHVFEAWFGSSADYEDQRARGLVACPLCGDGTIDKAVMAPAVGAKGNRSDSPPPAVIKAAMAALASAQAKALEGSEWVGAAFAGRARAMHAGDEEPAPIHGQATIAQAKEMIEDGVPVAPLPLPVIPPEACN
ncbi:DUF1178 family protein [Sphingomonas sp.]|uniref:DUF1178 family protein n=1 Tax=Sphingomonas sp. TaxID=28214 RepID=UPI002E353144|nr:DUF1178 family protein [Sphingomonas sp.]HEX4693878.1 DUF1178 family protein [Sphingomonas sp.]